jgi:single-stranded-DNA-specific exonuclease
MDSLLKTNYADRYLDLVALGNTADMMDIREFETKHLIVKGFRDENIHNPFIRGMVEKNAFSIGPKLTSMGAAFYIAPFVNAMVRSGEKEEKEILFQSMLNFKAYEKILSNKRGHKPGEMENLVTQALRTATNVKNRQKKIEDETLAKLEGLIKERNLLDHKVLLFLLAPGQVDRNVAGLIANKFMAKYQRPCCILTRVTEMKQKVDPYDLDQRITWTEVSYQGSARGCDLAGISNFKDICEQTNKIIYAQGHQGAFGLGIFEENISAFLEETDKILSDMSNEAVYYVDYIFDNSGICNQMILDIAYLDDLWGSCMPEPYVAFKNLKVKKDMVTVYSKKNLTLKIQLSNFVSIMLFNAPEELCDKLQNHNPGYYTMDIVGRCNKNEWNGAISPQVFIEDYELTGQVAFDF